MSTRREFTRNTIGAAIGLPFLFAGGQTASSVKKKIVCVGGHPDDPETGCGGTLALLAAAGHEVTIVYLTSGEAGIPGKSHQEAAAIRTKEAVAACVHLKAKPVFAGQVDGDTIVNNDWVDRLKKIMENLQPDIVFTHWPIDSHKDHQAASLLTIQCRHLIEKKFDLYFFEVCTGNQTQGFHPTDYVDISSTQEIKKRAVYCHTSQGPLEIYTADDCNHAIMEAFRGKEIGVKAAEAFVRLGASNIV